MAHFFASVTGSNSRQSALGTKSSGISTTVAGWQGAVRVSLRYDAASQTDLCTIWALDWPETPGGSPRIIYDGPVTQAGLTTTLTDTPLCPGKGE